MDEKHLAKKLVGDKHMRETTYIGEKGVGEKHTLVPSLGMEHIWVKGLLVRKNKTYVGKNQFGATYICENSVCEKEYG